MHKFAFQFGDFICRIIDTYIRAIRPPRIQLRTQSKAFAYAIFAGAYMRNPIAPIINGGLWELPDRMNDGY